MTKFLDEFEKLVQSAPRAPTWAMWRENSPYSNRGGNIKNSYWIIDFGYIEDSAYQYFPYKLKDCFDCSFTFESELCYECVDCYRCYVCSFSHECQRCTTCHFSVFCRDCQDCFGCVGLQHKQFCIYNQQSTKAEYEQKIKRLRSHSAGENLKHVSEITKDYPRPASHQYKSENTPYGDYITTSKNSYWVFDCIGLEDCGYMYQSKFNQDSFDSAQCYKNELCYECDSGGFNYDCSHVREGSHNSDCHFLVNCSNCKHCYGCINLTQAKYCILNQQYSKDDYNKKVNQIRKELGWPNPQS